MGESNSNDSSVWFPAGVDVESIATGHGLEATGAHVYNEIIQLAKDRILDRQTFAEALRFGTFSLLLEAVSRLTGPMEERIGAASQLAQLFQERNKALIKEPISEENLVHFARIIVENNWRWEDLCVAYLDPEAVRIDRLRENLERSPTERWQRHRRFMRNLRHIKRA